ncbi:hypothetical protein [Steroidobacter sp.]|uniref:hypothetical protein n=1 Tax=Steroidobacter sp. TaxID=1978227 RepID=UPI001A3DB1F4|nr:hypothetical protein [Steroidobacter sp.]MBL8269951.1 hypothetical protein [Steroidobacter sp.]
MRRLALLALVFGYTSSALAGSVTSTVASIRVDADGKGMIFFNQAISGTLSCRDSGYASALSFDSTTAGGKSILATALAAKASGATLSAVGTAACNVYGNWVEGLSYMHIL